MSADLNLVFCTALNVFGNGTTVLSTDWIDWKVAMDLAAGKEPVLEFAVTTTPSGGTSMEFQLTAVDSAGNNPVVLDTTGAIAIANLVAPTGTPPMGGTVRHLRMSPKPTQPTSLRTHLRLQVVNVGNNIAGAITAHLTNEPGTAVPTKAYAAGY